MRTGALVFVVTAALLVSAVAGAVYIGSGAIQSPQTTAMGTTMHPSTQATAAMGPTGTMGMAEAVAMMSQRPSGAVVDMTTDTLTFTSPSLAMTVFTAAPGNATRATGMNPPSYSQGDVFVNGGMVDPTLYIPSGARVNFTVVNMDGSMFNDFVVSTIPPSYSYSMSQYMTWAGPGMMGAGFQGFANMMPVLNPANYSGG